MAWMTLPLILPAALLLVGCGFLAISRLGMAGAFAWGSGLSLYAVGLAIPAALGPAPLAILTSNALIIAGLFFFAQAYLIHFEQPSRRREFLTIAATCVVLDAYVLLHLGSSRIALSLIDFAIAGMVGLALAQVTHVAVTRIDRALILSGSLIVITSLTGVLAELYRTSPRGMSAEIGWLLDASAVKAASGIAGILFVMSIAAALADRLYRERRDAAERDPLTGLLNRAGFERTTQRRAGSGPLRGVVAVAEIDQFEELQARCGADAGDAAMREFAGSLGSGFGAASIRARLRGARFACFIPEALLAEAGVAAQAVRLRFAARDWRAFGLGDQVTVSFGVVRVAEGEAGIARPVMRAEACLLAARNGGSNQVVLEGGMFELKTPPAQDLPSNVIPLRRRPAGRNSVGPLRVSG